MATELAQAYVQIIPSAKGIKGMISSQLVPEADSAGESAGDSLGKTLAKTAMKVITVAAIGKAFMASLTAGGELQQSLGGIETLFKGSADKVKKNADIAYKTAGLSANKYMENVTSFSASLLQSMGGDTEKAAKKADMAMIDMSDNANKMGTNIGDIQNAYQGFAKQNYTMLDNLKLGYGGTKEEMQRLLRDAEKLTGVKYDIGNLDDVYSAIHAVQGELGITGTTAKEAAETLTGSFDAMKGTFSNLLGKLALGEDIGPSLKALGETTSTFFVDNFLPMVGNILKGLPEIIGTILLEIGKKIAEFTGFDFSGVKLALDEAFAPFGGLSGIIDGVKVAIGGLVKNMTEIGAIALGAVGDWFKWLASPDGEIARAILSGFAIAIGVVSAAFVVYNIALGIATGVTTAFTTVLGVLTSPITLVIAAITALTAGFIYLWNTNEGFKNALIGIWTAISSFLQPIVGAIANFITTTWGILVNWWNTNQQSMSETVSTVWNAIKGVFDVVLEAISLVVTTVLDNIQSFWNTWGDTILSFVKSFWGLVSTTFENTLGNILAVVTLIFNQIGNVISTILNGVQNIIKVILSAIKGDWQGAWDGIKGIISAFGEFFKDSFDNFMNFGKSIIKNGIKAIKDLFGDLKNIDLLEAGKAIIDGFVKGLKKAWEAGKKFVSGIADWIKEHKGPIAYDKKLLKPAGNAIMSGFNDSLKQNFKEVQSTVGGMANQLASSFKLNEGLFTVEPLANLVNQELDDIKKTDVQFVASKKLANNKGNSSQLSQNNGTNTTITNSPEINVYVNEWKGKEDIEKTMQEIIWQTQIEGKGGLDIG